MRLMLVHVFYKPQSVGGATRVVEDNARDFAASGLFEDIAVFCTIEGFGVDRTRRYYRTPEAAVYAVKTPIDADGEYKLRDPIARAAFEDAVEAFQPDLIHFHCVQRMTSEVVDVAKEKGAPYIITMHDGWWISPHQFMLDDAGTLALYDYADPQGSAARFGDAAHARLNLLRPQLDGAHELLTVSDSFAAIVRQAGIKRVKTTSNGVTPMDTFPKDQHAVTTIGYLAGLNVYKGYYLLRGVVEQGDYDRLRFIVIDHALAQGEERHERWGRSEVLVRALAPQGDMPRLYQQLHVLAAPSLWPESFGLAAREALQSGAWVVASNRGGLSDDVIEGENGHVFDPSQPKQLATILQRINDHPKIYQSPCKRVSLRTSKQQAETLMGLYQSILES